MPATIGIIANPASGKDIRRLVAHASTFDNEEKRRILRRVILGAQATGVYHFHTMPDSHGLAAAAFDGLAGVIHEPVAIPRTGSALDSTRAASALRDLGCAVVITLGGDGTNRAVARGWRDAPLVALSTGTNNVFPMMVEGTVAGMAAGLVAAGALSLADVSRQAKTITVAIEGEADDLALIDAVLVDARHTGARALWQPGQLRAALLARAEPAATGIAAIGGLLCPVTEADDQGLDLRFGPGGACVRAPFAPGQFEDVAVHDARPLPFGAAVELTGPGVLALDGERERVLRPGQRVRMWVARDGPWVIDVARALHHAALSGALVQGRTVTAG